MKKFILVFALSFLPALALAVDDTSSSSSSSSSGSGSSGGGSSNCQAQEMLVNQARDKVNAVPTNTPGYDSLISAVKTQVQQFGKSGCNFSGNNVPSIGTENHQSMDAYQTPASPGDKSLPIDTTFLKGFTEPKSDSMPKNMDSNYKPTFADATAAISTTTTPTNNACGTIASAFGTYASNLTGSEQFTYKQGCSGVDLAGNAASSADAPGTACQGNQIGKFGLVQAAYNNSQQAVNTSDLATKTPSSSNSGNTVAFYDKTTGAKNEPNGCRLTSYASCGQAGDVIMVQTKANATDTSTFDTYLIYDGKGGFYYVLPNSTPAVKHGALPGDYANASYSATRLGCATTPTTTATAGH